MPRGSGSGIKGGGYAGGGDFRSVAEKILPLYPWWSDTD